MEQQMKLFFSGTFYLFIKERLEFTQPRVSENGVYSIIARF